MKNLFEIFTSIVDKNEDQYYGNYTNKINPVLNTNLSEDYIRNYFKMGGKTRVFDLDKFRLYRTEHTISAFLIGIYLSEFANLKEIISRFHYNNDFLYYWFLTCLFHDFGYFYEKSIDNFYFNFHRAHNFGFKIDHSLYSNKITKNYGTIFKPETIVVNLNERNFIYDRELVNNYFIYCKKELGFYNHSIIAGLHFYNSMVENLLNEYIEVKNLTPTTNINSFTSKGLQWGVYQIDIFREIADVIISHNIWRAEEKNESIYKTYNIEKLNHKNFKRISIKQQPLLFLLCLVDTLEPTKKFFDLTEQTCWKNLYIYYEDNVIYIKNLLKNHEKYVEWKENILRLNLWLDVNVVEKNHVIEIRIGSNNSC